MASELNTNELNRLENDGRIPSDSVELEDKKTLEEVEEGKKTTEQLPQLLSPARILDEAQHNDIYKLILGPCSAEGFNVNQKLLELLKDKKIKPIELENVLDDTMQEIIQYVNQNDAYPIMFSDEGKINVEETVQKAQRTNRKVSRYVTSLAEDSGMKIEDLRNKETIFGIDVARNKSIEECALLDQLFASNVEEYKGNFDRIFNSLDDIDVRKNNKGEDVLIANQSEDITVLLNICKRLDTWIGKIPEDIGERDRYVLDMLRIYNYLNDSNLLAKLPDKDKDIYLQLIDNAKAIIEKRYENYPGGSIKDEEKINAILSDLHKEKSDIEDITQTQIYGDIKGDLKQLNVVDVTLDVAEERKRLSIDTIMSICTASDYYTRFMETTNNSVLKKTFANNEKIMANVIELYPDYAKEAKEKAQYDGYALVRLNALREIQAEKLLLEHKGDPKYSEPNKLGGMNIVRYNQIRAAAGILNSLDFSVELRTLAIETIKDYLPEVEIDEETEKALIENKDPNVLREISNRIQQEAMYKTFFGENKTNILSGADFALTGLSLIDSRTKGQIFKAMHDSVHKGEELNIEVLESERYKKLVEDGISKYDYKFFTTKKLEYLMCEMKAHAKIADEKQYNRERNIDPDNSNKIDYNDILFAKKLVEAAKLLEGKDVKSIERMVKEYLIDYLPDAFGNNGEIKINKIDECFEDFLHKNGYDREEIPDVVAKMDRDIDTAFNDEIEKYKITNDVISQALEAEQKIKADLGYDAHLEEIEDTVMFTNYILSKGNGLAKESKEELEENVTKIQSKLDKHHESVLSHVKRTHASLIGEHDNYDKNRVKSKFVYLEKEARKVIATERINESSKRLIRTDRLTIDQKEEIQGILGTYFGILNDYKNEELKVEDYNELREKQKALLKKVDPSLIDEDGNINDDKVLDKYNEINGTNFYTVDSVVKYEEMELLMRYARRLAIEIENGGSKYRNVIADRELYINSKIHEKLQEDVHLDTEKTNRLISDVWKYVSMDSSEGLSKEATLECIKNLALIEGKFGKKELNKTGLSYEAGMLQELQRKTLGIARMKLAEFFPEITREENVFDISKLEESLTKYLIENDPELSEELKQGKKVLKVLTRQREEGNLMLMGPMPKAKTTKELLTEANAILKGEEKEKTYEDNVLVAAMTLKMLGDIGKPEMVDRLLKKLTRHMSEEEKDQFVQDCKERKVDEKTTNAMRRVAGLINIEKYNEQLKMDIEGKSKVPMDHDNIADYLLVAVGSLVSCSELPNTEINLSAQKDITDFIKSLAPKTVNSKGKVDYKKLMNVVNDLRSRQLDKNGNYEEIKTKEEFISTSVRKANVRLGIELYRGKIDSRFTNKYYVPVENRGDGFRPISGDEMDRVVESRGEEIVVDPEAIREPVEGKKKEEDVVISEEEFDGMFAENAVELGGEEPAPEVTEGVTPKVEQQVAENSQGVHAETIEVSGDTWRENLPVERRERGFLGNIFDKIKAGIKIVKDKIFGTTESNTETGTTDNNTAGTTSGTGGVNKDEQDVDKSNDWAQPAIINVKAAKDKTDKANAEKGKGEQEHEEVL